MVHDAIGLLLSIVLVLGAVLACGDPAWGLAGTVVDAAGTPISGATVKVICPSRPAPLDTGITTAAGEINLGGIPDAPAGCHVEVSATGHTTATFAMGAFCYRSTGAGTFGKACPPGSGKVVLP